MNPNSIGFLEPCRSHVESCGVLRITVPAGGQATIPITYRPLTMTRAGDAEA